MDFFDEGQNVDYEILVLRRIFILFFVVLGNWGLYLAFCQAYGYPRADRVIIVNCILYSVIFLFIFSLPKRKSILGFIIVGIVYLSRILSCNSDIERQAAGILKYIRRQALVYYDQSPSSESLSGIYVRSNSSGQALILAILFISVALMIASVLNGTRFVTIILIISVLMADMMYGMTPKPMTALCVFVCAVGLCGMAQTKDSCNGRWKVIEGRSFSFSPLCALGVAVIISILLGGLVYGIAGKRLLSGHEKYWKIQSKLELKVQEAATKIENRFERVMNKQRLNNDPPDQTGKLIMTIRADRLPNNSIYLRESSSDTYNNNEWNSMIDYNMPNESSLELFSQNYNLINDIASHSLSGAGNILTGEERRGIQNITMNIDYSFYASNLVFPYWADIAGAAYSSESGTIFSNGNDRSLSRSGGRFTFQLYDISDKSMMKLLNQSKLQLTDTRLYDEYASDAQRYYVKFPGSLTELAGFAKKIKTVRSVTGGAEAQFGRQCSYIRNSVWDKVYYSRNLNELPSGADFVEDFLLHQKRGYCVHYATTGTLLCRMKNLPARYVTGYRVDPSHFRKIYDRDGNVVYLAEVLDTQGHAWTEVYKSYLGWVPVEMTEAEDTDGTEYFYDAEKDVDIFQSDVDGNDIPDIDNNGDSQTGQGENDENNQTDDSTTKDNTTKEDDTEEIVSDESPQDDDGDGTEQEDIADENGNNSGVIKNGEGTDSDEGKFRSVILIIIAVAVSLALAALAARYIILGKRIKEKKEYDSLDRSGKLLMRVKRVGKESAKAVRLKYKTLDDRDILGVFMRIGDGGITKQEIDKLEGILERSAFAENEISEEKFAAAGLILDKVEGKIKAQGK